MTATTVNAPRFFRRMTSTEDEGMKEFLDEGQERSSSNLRESTSLKKQIFRFIEPKPKAAGYNLRFVQLMEATRNAMTHRRKQQQQTTDHGLDGFYGAEGEEPKYLLQHSEMANIFRILTPYGRVNPYNPLASLVPPINEPAIENFLPERRTAIMPPPASRWNPRGFGPDSHGLWESFIEISKKQAQTQDQHTLSTNPDAPAPAATGQGQGTLLLAVLLFNSNIKCTH